MPSITIKNVPEEIYEKIKRQAKRRHRSINKEIIACLEESVSKEELSVEAFIEDVKAFKNKIKGSLSLEEIQAAIDEGRP